MSHGTRLSKMRCRTAFITRVDFLDVYVCLSHCFFHCFDEERVRAKRFSSLVLRSYSQNYDALIVESEFIPKNISAMIPKNVLLSEHVLASEICSKSLALFFRGAV